MQPEKPFLRPLNNNFSSGPCAKRPGWSVDALANSVLGRSHRANPSRKKLSEVIDRSRAILGVPDDYLIGIVPGSDTGAIEMAIWSLIGARGVDLLAWENFGEGWITDIVDQLKIRDVRTFQEIYGKLAVMTAVDFSRDVIFTWNGTTSGVRVPDGEWIADNREGLVIVDATSAVFAMDIPWRKTDVVTWSWQKVLGGEGAHGMIALSPRAIARLENYQPAWPLPKIFRLTSDGKLIRSIFDGDTINTPSLLATEDYLDALGWAEKIGGLEALISRSETNMKVLSDWVEKSDWADFLAINPAHRSCTSICLIIKAAIFKKLPRAEQGNFANKITIILENEAVAYDIASSRYAPPGLRIWGGSTIESSDIEKLIPWLDWAFLQVASEYEG